MTGAGRSALLRPSGLNYPSYFDSLLKTKTDGKSQTTTFVYDKLKRLKEKQYPSGQKIIYTFSGENLGSVQDQVVSETTTFGYDSSYRLSSIVNPRGTISYGYTADDQLQTCQVNSDPRVALSSFLASLTSLLIRLHEGFSRNPGLSQNGAQGRFLDY